MKSARNTSFPLNQVVSPWVRKYGARSLLSEVKVQVSWCHSLVHHLVLLLLYHCSTTRDYPAIQSRHAAFCNYLASWKLLKLSSTSTWLLVGSWLFCIQHPPFSVSFRCMLGGTVEIRRKNILYQVIEGQTHFGMPRGAKMSFALHEPN